MKIRFKPSLLDLENEINMNSKIQNEITWFLYNSEYNYETKFHPYSL